MEDPETGTQFYFLNMYGPFYDRRKYWETLSSDGACEHANLILEGDPNLTLIAGEVWGKNARLDTLANFVSTLFEQNKLIDLRLIRLEATWKNNTGGDQEISNILDRFLLLEGLFQYH